MRVVDKPFGDKLLKEFRIFGSHGFEFGDLFVESKGGHRIAVVITGSDQTEDQAKSEVGRLLFQLREGKQGRGGTERRERMGERESIEDELRIIEF